MPDLLEHKLDPVSSHLWIPAFAGMTPLPYFVACLVTHDISLLSAASRLEAFARGFFFPKSLFRSFFTGPYTLVSRP
jgi:hypothetical protein